MTFRRAGLAFALQHLQGVDERGTGVLRFDDQTDHTSHRSLIWCGKVVDVFLSFGFYIRVVFENDISCTGRTHYCYLRSWPGYDLIGTEVL